MSIRIFAAAILLALALGGGVAQAGSQPSVGIIRYNPAAQISEARTALRLAKTTLSDALAKSKSLVAKAERTVDLKAKLKLLQQAADLLTKANKLRQQIEQLEATLKNLGIAKEVYENQLALEKKAAELAAQQQLEAQQVAAQQAAAAAALPATTAAGKWSIDALSPVGKEIVERISGLGWISRQVDEVAEHAHYAVLANASYTFDEPEGWQAFDTRWDTLSASGVSAMAFKSEDPGNNEIVIAFRGSVTGTDWLVNAGLGLAIDATKVVGGAVLGVVLANETKNLALERFEESLAFAREVKRKNPGSVITVTGHSLGGGIAQYVAASLEIEAVAFDPAPIASFLDDTGKSKLKSYGNIQNFRNGSDPLTAVDVGIIGEKPMTINATNDVALSNLWDVGGWLDIADANHSSAGLAIAMSSVEFARCYIIVCDK